MIEEIGEVSDDEEVYGDLQEMRTDRDDEIREHFVEHGGNWFDEFQLVRKTNHGVKMADS